MRRSMRCGLVALSSLLFAGLAHADPKPVSYGHVWQAWYAHVEDNRWDDYMAFLSKVHRPELEALKKHGYIVGYQILRAEARSPEDYNLAVILEYENWAAFDRDPKALDEAEANAVKNVPDLETLEKNKNAMRRVVGYRVFQDIDFK